MGKSTSVTTLSAILPAIRAGVEEGRKVVVVEEKGGARKVKRHFHCPVVAMSGSWEGREARVSRTGPLRLI